MTKVTIAGGKGMCSQGMRRIYEAAGPFHDDLTGATCPCRAPCLRLVVGHFLISSD